MLGFVFKKWKKQVPNGEAQAVGLKIQSQLGGCWDGSKEDICHQANNLSSSPWDPQGKGENWLPKVVLYVHDDMHGHAGSHMLN